MSENASIQVAGEIEYPPLVKRIQALFVDSVLILLLFSLSSVLLGNGSATWLKAGIFIFSIFLYEPTLISFTGNTLGQKLVGIRVTRYTEPKKNISLVQASIRVVVKFLLGWASFLSIIFNREKRGLHDMASSSVVRYK